MSAITILYFLKSIALKVLSSKQFKRNIYYKQNTYYEH